MQKYEKGGDVSLTIDSTDISINNRDLTKTITKVNACWCKKVL